MKILCVDHIGIAVKNADDVIRFYSEILGLEVAGSETVQEQKVKTVFLPVGNEAEIELLESTDVNGPVAKFIERNGEGIQHIALRVDDIEAILAELRKKGIRLIDETPRYGAGGAKIAFIHPKSTNGVLLELCQRD